MAGRLKTLAHRAACLIRLTAAVSLGGAQAGCVPPMARVPSLTMPAATTAASLVVRAGAASTYRTSYVVPAQWDSVTATLTRGGATVAIATAAVALDAATQQRNATLTFPKLSPGDGYSLQLRFEIARPGGPPQVLGVTTRDQLTLAPGPNTLVLDARPQATPSVTPGAPLGAYVESMPVAGPPATIADLLTVIPGPHGDYFYLDQHAVFRMYRDAQGALTTALIAGAPGEQGVGFVDGPGAQARFQYPMGLALDDAGALYLSDSFNNAIRKVSFDTHGAATVTTVIGDGQEGAQDGGPGVGRLAYPSQVAFDAAGHLIILDGANNSLRRLTLGGGGAPTLSTIATASGGYQDGDASVAKFDYMLGMTVDRGGRIFVSEGTPRIRMLAPTPDGSSYTVSTVAGSGDWGAADGPGTSATFSSPNSLCVDPDGNLLVLDAGTGIRQIAPSSGGWTVSTIAAATGYTFGDGPAMTMAYVNFDPRSIALDADGSILLGGRTAIQRITKPGAADSMAVRVAGQYGDNANVSPVGGPAADLPFVPSTLAVDAGDNVYALEGSTATLAMFPAGQPAGTIRTITPLAPDPETNGYESLLAPQFSGLLTRDGLTFYYALNGQRCLKRLTRDALDAARTTIDIVAGAPNTSGIQDGPGTSARFGQPGPTVFGPDGSLYVADGNVVRRVALSADGTAEVTTVVGRVSPANTGEGPASTASFGTIMALAFNRQGDLFILDALRVHRLTFKPDGTPDRASVVIVGATGFGGSVVRFTAMAIDAKGHVYVSDDLRIFKLTHDDFDQWRPTQLAGSITGYADGPVAKAKFASITAMAMDSANRLYVVDQANALIRRITLPPDTP